MAQTTTWGLGGRTPLLLLVAALAAYAYGPGLPITDAELRAAYGGRRVVVCGSSYGIGADIAYGLAQSGAHLVLSARSKDKLERVAARCRELGAASVRVHAADLSTKEGARGLIDSAEKALGGIDYLILNHIIGMYEDWAGAIMQGHKDKNLDESLTWVDKIFRVNILSYIYLSSYALPALSQSEHGGRIIAVGSGAGKSGFPRVAPYSSTKHAVFGYFDSLRQDLIESSDPALRRVEITQGVLGAFTTESFKTGTAGKLDPKFIPQNDPSVAAWDLLKGGARGYQTIYTPWSQVRLVVLLQGLMPRVMDWVLRKAALAGEVVA